MRHLTHEPQSFTTLLDKTEPRYIHGGEKNSERLLAYHLLGVPPNLSARGEIPA